MKPILHGACPTCDMLWREFAHATAEHVKLIMESQRVVTVRDKAHDETLAVAIGMAGQRRESVRIAIRVHESGAHEDPKSGTVAGS